MLNFFKFGRIFSVKLQINPSGTWQQCIVEFFSTWCLASRKRPTKAEVEYMEARNIKTYRVEKN
jgi:hypothetical protein